jgi:type I restriction enzyme S subunit
MSKNNKILPEIRFPKFEKYGEWEQKELSQLGNLINGLTYSPKDVREKGLLVLRSSNVQNGVVDFKDCVFVRPDIKGANLSEPNDILVCVRNGSKRLIGKNALIPIDISQATHGAFMTMFRAKYPEFVFQLFQSEAYDKQVKSDLGATINSINGKNFLKYKFLVPRNPKEQQRIASCLSSLDELIAAYNDKLNALKEHKKGLMQNLFPQEGQKVPSYRFPEFENDAEWVEKKLGDEDVSGFVNDKVDSQNLTLKNYISTNNMLSDYSGIADASKLPTISRVTEFIEGDILISNIRPYLKKVWKSDRQGGASNDVLVFRSGTKVKSEFLECILKNDAFINYVMKSAKGVKMPRGDKDSMLKYSIRIPARKEQKKIASCLSAVDELITAQSEKIEQLQQHKQGLMQGLFPKIES